MGGRQKAQRSAVVVVTQVGRLLFARGRRAPPAQLAGWEGGEWPGSEEGVGGVGEPGEQASAACAFT